MPEEKKHSRGMAVAVVGLCVLLVLCLALLWQLFGERNAAPSFEQTQSEYVQPETPVDRSKSIVLPGWGAFSIPSGTKEVAQGFEFHNPAENLWYEDKLRVGSGEPETLVVDSGEAVELSHYLGLAGKEASVVSVLDYDPQCFAVEQNSQGAYTVKAIAGFEGEKAIEVETASGSHESITASCTPECYYMTFALYLDDGDELLYESGLVAPGKYLQQMELSRALDPGAYDAYVVCQPYKSDQKTKTNQGVVRIALNVQ